jgi:hypothetical protein
MEKIIDSSGSGGLSDVSANGVFAPQVEQKLAFSLSGLPHYLQYAMTISS